MTTLQERAKQAHPNNEQHQQKWLGAVQHLGPRWVAAGAVGFKMAPEAKASTPPLAHRVIRSIRRGQ